MAELRDYLNTDAAPAQSVDAEQTKCAACGDLGLVRVDVSTSHPLFGRLLPCTSCVNSRVIVGSDPDGYGLLPADRGLEWNRVYDVHPDIADAKRAVREALQRGCGWVYLWGGYGTAKTMILKTAVAQTLRLGEIAAYTRMADLMDEIRQAYDTANPNGEAIKRLRWWSRMPVLAIDEFEKVSETEFVNERRFRLMDSRYETATRQAFGVTILAANVPPDRLPGALASRVRDGRFEVIHIKTKDLRPIAEEF